MASIAFGLFWDYENVPFQKGNRESFGIALKNFLSAVNVVFAKVYSHKAYPEEVFDSLRKIPKLQIKSVDKAGPNAADQSLIQSCQSVMKEKPEISHVVLISGDDDFRMLINELKNQGKTVGIISSSNCSKKLQKKAHIRFNIEKVIENPMNWWKPITSIKPQLCSPQSVRFRNRGIELGSDSRSKMIYPKPISPNQRALSLILKSNTNHGELLASPKKKHLSFTPVQWNEIIEVIGKIFQEESQKNDVNQLNSVEITYALNQRVKTGELTVKNYEIYLLIKKLGEIGFLVEIYSDSWRLAENHVQDLEC